MDELKIAAVRKVGWSNRTPLLSQENVYLSFDTSRGLSKIEQYLGAEVLGGYLGERRPVSTGQQSVTVHGLTIEEVSDHTVGQLNNGLRELASQASKVQSANRALNDALAAAVEAIDQQLK